MIVGFYKKIILFLILLLCVTNIYGYEKSSAFVITLYSNRIKVISPQKFTVGVSSIIENKTLIKTYGKLITSEGRLITIFSVNAGGFAAYDLDLRKGERAYLVPLSPAFQEFELKFGSKPYEIPPKSKD